MDFFSSILTAEILLKLVPNGGLVIIVRAVIVSIILYCIGLGLRSYTSPNAILCFSKDEFIHLAHDTLPWFGAILAACYAALYTRFSNHCAYLANLYNDTMAVKIALEAAENPKSITALIRWQVAFIIDAESMHLARKDLFSGPIKSMLKEDAIRIELEKSCENHQDYLSFCKKIGYQPPETTDKIEHERTDQSPTPPTAGQAPIP